MRKLPVSMPRVVGPVLAKTADRLVKTDKGLFKYTYTYPVVVNNMVFCAYTKKHANTFAWLMGSRQRFKGDGK